ncbi:hypothetical protein NGB36_25005 [Streptomyces sp. RB6PN25]|uniref:Uncharacterized protein n=1 Tax=Streptomyces humicola TaxID=2953240 RepID=A0ABT1Q1F1_9ACTN|nr:hypothetical protein [Streptomyces humicola]MCQ4083763.1 hypothetical protein [Streptomyces humicola]
MGDKTPKEPESAGPVPRDPPPTEELPGDVEIPCLDRKEAAEDYRETDETPQEPPD